MQKPPFYYFYPYNPLYNSSESAQYYHFPLYYNSFYNTRVFPTVNPTILMNSAKKSTELLSDAQKVTEGVYSSHDFSKQLMEAAQQSKTETVRQLIKSLALQNHSEIKYNPDGIQIILSPKDVSNNCCVVSLSLKWNEFTSF